MNARNRSDLSWFSDLTPAMRAELRRLHRVDPWKSVVKLVLLLLIWGASAWLALQVEPWWWALPCYLMIGFVFHALMDFGHFGVHETIFGKRWIDRAAGQLCALPVFFPLTNYQANHRFHHRHVSTAKDPDNMDARIPDPRVRRLVFWSWLGIGILAYMINLIIAGPRHASNRRERFFCRLEPLLLTGFYVVLFVLSSRHDFTDVLIRGWLSGIPFAMLIANIRAMAEHNQLRQTSPPTPLNSARTTLSNPFLRFFFNNQNFHLEHHLFPKIPWHNLGKANRLLLPAFIKHKASVVKGYRQHYLGILKWGSARSFSYTADHRPIPDSR